MQQSGVDCSAEHCGLCSRVGLIVQQSRMDCAAEWDGLCSRVG